MEYIVLTAPNNGETEAEVREAVASTHPEYRIERVAEKNGQWHVRLAAGDEESGSKPPFPPKKKDDSDDDVDDIVDKSDSDDSDSKDSEEDAGEKPEGESKPKDPVAQIQSLLSELQTAVKGLADKAKTVDEIHDKVKDHVEDGAKPPTDAPVPLPEDVGPTPGSGPAAAPAPPAAPKRPGVPGGGARGARPPAGLLPTFTNRRTHIVEHPIKDEEGEYTLAHVEAAIKAEPQLEGFKIAGTQTDDENNVYRVKLVLA